MRVDVVSWVQVESNAVVNFSSLTVVNFSPHVELSNEQQPDMLPVTNQCPSH